MTQQHDDERLREGFQELRADTRASGRVPDFRTMIDRARSDAAGAPRLEVVTGGASGRPSRRWMQAGWASAAIAAAVAGVLLVTGGPSADEEFERLVAAYATDVAAGAWRSPTSALLRVPGMSLTRSVPDVGGTIRGMDPSRPSNTPEEEGRDS